MVQWPSAVAKAACEAGLLWITNDELTTFLQRVKSESQPILPVINKEISPSPSPGGFPPDGKAKGTGSVSEPQPVSGPRHPDSLEAVDVDPQIYILRMHALGNSYGQIRSLLGKKIHDAGELESALAQVDLLESQERFRQNKRLLLILPMLVFLLAAIGVGKSLFISPHAAQVSGTTPAATETQPITRSGIVNLLKLSTPVIQRYPTLASSNRDGYVGCPRNVGEAVRLFGGHAEDWKSSNGGWIMINPNRPATINVPDGMSAAYLLLGKGFSLAEVEGPAKMENVYYVTISCP